MTASENPEIVKFTMPVPAPRRGRSRLGELSTVTVELIIADSTTAYGEGLLKQQAAAVREALRWFADHPPNGALDLRPDS